MKEFIGFKQNQVRKCINLKQIIREYLLRRLKIYLIKDKNRLNGSSKVLIDFSIIKSLKNGH